MALYITEEEAKSIAEGETPRTLAQLTYVIGQQIVRDWLADTSQSNLAKLRLRYIINPRKDQALLNLRRATVFNDDAIVAASMAAFDEFNRRVGSWYCQAASKTKGVVDPFIKMEAIWPNAGLTRFKVSS